MNNTIDVVLRAISIAKNCGLPEDLDLYAQAYSRLQCAVTAIREHDKQLNDDGKAPTGSDYEHVLQTLGLIREQPAARAASTTPCPVPALSVSPTDVVTAAVVMGLSSATETSSVEVTVQVVNPTEDFIGGNDIDKMPAVLNLHTGHLDLIDPRLGHPVLCMDDIATIVHRGVTYQGAFITDSVPEDIAHDAIVTHIREHGYRASIDVTSIRYAGEGKMA